jgi:hypothetical protein
MLILLLLELKLNSCRDVEFLFVWTQESGLSFSCTDGSANSIVGAGYVMFFLSMSSALANNTDDTIFMLASFITYCFDSVLVR